MFEGSAYTTGQAIGLTINGLADKKNQIDREALQLYHLATRQGWVTKLKTAIGRRDCSLLDLKAVLCKHKISGRHYLGIQTVRISQIKGSEGRCEDFDADFHPIRTHTRARWISIARARLLGKPLPPVELILIGDMYFVRDGHHRISVAQANGQEAIEAEVTRWQVDGQNPTQWTKSGDCLSLQPA